MGPAGYKCQVDLLLISFFSIIVCFFYYVDNNTKPPFPFNQGLSHVIDVVVVRGYYVSKEGLLLPMMIKRWSLQVLLEAM